LKRSPGRKDDDDEGVSWPSNEEFKGVEKGVGQVSKRLSNL